MICPESLKSARVSRGLTQAQAADLVGVIRATWARWEAGTYAPAPKYVPLLVEHFGIDLNPGSLGDHRVLLGLSQAEFSKLVGTTKPMVSMVESGNLLPAHVDLWAEQLGVDVEEFGRLWLLARCGKSSDNC